MSLAPFQSIGVRQGRELTKESLNREPTCRGLAPNHIEVAPTYRLSAPTWPLRAPTKRLVSKVAYREPCEVSGHRSLGVPRLFVFWGANVSGHRASVR